MKLLLPITMNTVPKELSQPIPVTENLRLEKNRVGTEVYFVGRKVGTLYTNLENTQTKSMWCPKCGCEPYAVWPVPNYSFLPLGGYDKNFGSVDAAWKARVDAALRPLFERDKISSAFFKKVQEEQFRFSDRPCPVCGSKLEFGKNANIEMLEAYNKLKSYTASCDIPVPVTANPEAVLPIKTDIEKLKDYLLRVINVEKNIKFIHDRLLVLYIMTFDVNREAKFAQLYPIMAERDRVTKAIAELQDSLQRKSLEIDDLKKRRESLSTQVVIGPSVVIPKEPVAPQQPTLATPNLFNKKRVLAENTEKTNAYNRAMAQYEAELAQYPLLLQEAQQKKEAMYQEALRLHQVKLQALDSEIAQKVTAFEAFKQETEAKQRKVKEDFELLEHNTSYPAVQLKITLDKEITDAESLLKELHVKKYQLYGMDIIFRKYRDLVAVSSFYEYLLSGRCEALDGVNGCYNLYESELRANRIINQLEQIGSSMEQIKDNQYMLYSQLSDISTELSALNATTASMLQTMHSTAEAFLEQNAVIAHNSAVTAYYARINAEIASSTRYIKMISW